MTARVDLTPERLISSGFSTLTIFNFNTRSQRGPFDDADGAAALAAARSQNFDFHLSHHFQIQHPTSRSERACYGIQRNAVSGPDHLDRQRNALAAADAQGNDGALAAVALHRMWRVLMACSVVSGWHMAADCDSLRDHGLERHQLQKEPANTAAALHQTTLQVPVRCPRSTLHTGGCPAAPSSGPACAMRPRRRCARRRRSAPSPARPRR